MENPKINLYYVSSRGTEGPYTFDQTLKLVDHGYIHTGTFVHLNESENWVAYENSYIFPLIKGSIKARKSDLHLSDTNSENWETVGGTYVDDESIPSDESSLDEPSGEEKSRRDNLTDSERKTDYRKRRHEKGAAADLFDIKDADLIWIPNEEDPAEKWMQARIEEEYDHGETLVVCVESGEELMLDKEHTHNHCNHEVYESPGQETNIMNLKHKNEPAVLHHLRQRFENRHAFTYLGSSILVVVTAHMHRDGVEEPEMLEFVSRGNEHLDKLMEVPHPFSIAERAFKIMQYVRSPQVIISSGEAGSGKSYSMGMVLRVLLERSKWLSHIDELGILEDSKIKIDPTDRDENGKQRKVSQQDSKAAQALFYDDGDKIPIDERIEAAHEVVDAFGHAMVFNSTNSSRFGRFTKLYYQFRDEDIPGKGLPAVADAVPLLCGCRFDCMMFEKARITNVMDRYNERNFHIFYMMLAARDREELDELQDFGIADASHFDLLQGPDEAVLGDAEDDEQSFIHLWNAMLTVGFADYEIVGLMRILLGILHLGNVIFDEHHEEGDDEDELAVVIHDGMPLEMAATAFDVEVEELFRTVTESKAGKGLNEHIISHSRPEAINSRNKIIQCMYEGVFRMIFNQVNHAVAPPTKAVEKKVNTLTREKKKRKGAGADGSKTIASYDEVMSFDLHNSTPSAVEEKAGVKSKHTDLASRNEAHMAKKKAAKEKKNDNDEEDEENRETDLFICMLDFPGFVNEDENTLDNFLTNYANEAIQNVYNHNVFDSSLGFFRKGGYEIDIHSIPNSYDCVNLVESPEYGIITALEEVCNMAMHNQTDDKLITALTKKKEIRQNPVFQWGADEHVDDAAIEAKNSHVQQLKMMGHAAQTSQERQNIEYTSMQASWDVGNPFTFVVSHFMGDSRYYLYPPELEHELDVVGSSWVDINVDLQPESLVPLCLSSALPELRALCLNFTSLLHLTDDQKANLTSAALATASAKYAQEILNHERHKLNDAASEGLLAVSRRSYKAGLFRKSISKLCDVMKTLPTYYIRCIIANYKMKPDQFYAQAVALQMHALCIPHTIETYSQTESFHFRFDHIITNLFPALESLMHKFLKMKEEVLVSCVLTALGLSPTDFHLSDKMVYLNAGNINQMIYHVQPPAPGSSEHFELLNGVRSALQKYGHAMGMVDSVDEDMDMLRTEVNHLMDFKDSLEKVVAIATDASVQHDNLPREKRDRAAEDKLSEQLTKAAYNLEKSKAEIEQGVAKMGAAAKSADKAHYYARHCWYDLCEKECSALMPPIKDAKRFVDDTIKHMIDNISGFEECSLVHEEAHMIAHKAKKEFAHLQTEKRAAAGHEAYKNYDPKRGKGKSVMPPPAPGTASGVGAPPPPNLQPRAGNAPAPPPGAPRADDESVVSNLDNHNVRSRTGVRMGMKDLMDKKKQMKLIAHHLRDEEEAAGHIKVLRKKDDSADIRTSKFPSKRKPAKKGDGVDKAAIKKKLIEVGYQIKEKGAGDGGTFMSLADVEAAKAAAVAEAHKKLETELLAAKETEMEEMREELRQLREGEEAIKAKAEASRQHAWSMAREEEESRRKHREEERERREELAAKHLSAAEEAEEKQRLELEEAAAENEHRLKLAALQQEEQLASMELEKQAAIHEHREQIEAKMKATEEVAAKQLKAVVLEAHKHAKATEELTMRADGEVELDALGEEVEPLDTEESPEEAQRHIDEADPKLVAFYATHAPDKLHTLPGTVARYKGREDELFRKLHAKYEVSDPEHNPSKRDLKDRKKREKEEKEAKKKKEEEEAHVFAKGQTVHVFAAQSVYAMDLPARNMMGGLPSAYLKIVRGEHVLHSTRVENWNNHPMWGRLHLAVEDLGSAGLDQQLVWEVVHKPDGADTNGKPHKVIGHVEFSLRAALEGLDKDKEYIATLMTHKHGGVTVPLKGGLLGRHSKIKIIRPFIKEVVSDGKHAIDDNNVTYGAVVDDSDSESSDESSDDSSDDSSEDEKYPKAMKMPIAKEGSGSEVSSLGAGTPDDASSAAVSLSDVYGEDDRKVSGSAAKALKKASSASKAARAEAKKGENKDTFSYSPADVDAGGFSEEVKADSQVDTKPRSRPEKRASTGILAKAGIRSSISKPGSSSAAAATAMRSMMRSPIREEGGDDVSVAGSVCSVATRSKHNHPLMKRMKEKRQQSVAVAKDKKSRDALKDIYEKVDSKLTPEVLKETHEHEYTEWATWLGSQTHDITQKNKDTIVARLIYRNISGPIRLGKVLSDVDAGLITAETDLAHLEGHGSIDPTPSGGKTLMTGEEYLEKVLHIDRYDSREILAAMSRQLLYKAPKQQPKSNTTSVISGTGDKAGEEKYNVANYSTLEPDAIKWVQWFRTHCPHMRVAMYKKVALALMDNNIASTSRLRLRMEDDPFLLTKRLGIDRYDADELKGALENEGDSNKAMKKTRLSTRFSTTPEAKSLSPAIATMASSGGRFDPHKAIRASTTSPAGDALSPQKDTARRVSLLQLTQRTSTLSPSPSPVKSPVGRGVARPRPTLLNVNFIDVDDGEEFKEGDNESD